MDFHGVDDEGFVVCDAHWNRVKIKSPKYVAAHYIRNNNCITKEKLIDVILQNEVSEFLLYVPEYTNAINVLKDLQNDIIEKIYDKIKELNPQSYTSRKEYADVVQKQDKWLWPFLFSYDHLDDTLGKLTATKWAKLMDEANER